MAVDAIIAVAGDVLFEEAATAVVADLVGEAVVETVVADAVGAVVADGVAAGLTDAALATAAEAAGATAAETALAGYGADAALAGGIDAAAGATAGAIAPATEAGALVASDAATALEGYDAAMADLAASNATAADVAATTAAETAGAVSPEAAADAAAVSDEAVASGGNLGNGAGGVPVEDAVPSWVNPNPTPDPTLAQGLKDYAGAVADSLGTAGLLGAGALGGAALAGALTPPALSGSVGSGTANYEWGKGTPLVNPGLNPGYIGYAASMPDYHSTNPTDAQYYWGVHAPVNTAADLATYNQLPAGAPTTPWGAGMGGHGATPGFNPADFVNQYILNPAWAGVNNATAPGYTAPGPAVPVIH